MSTWREWDWPQESRGRRGRLDRTIVDVEIGITPLAPRQRSIAGKIADIYIKVLVTVAKVVVAIVCTGLLLGSIWLIKIMVEAAAN